MNSEYKAMLNSCESYSRDVESDDYIVGEPQFLSMRQNPCFFALKDLPTHIQQMFEGVEIVNQTQKDARGRRLKQQRLWYKPDEYYRPESPVRLLVEDDDPEKRKPKNDHIGILFPKTFSEMSEDEISQIGNGNGFSTLKQKPVFSATAPHTGTLKIPEPDHYLDVLRRDTAVRSRFLIVSKKALDIIQRIVPSDEYSVSQAIQYEDINWCPPQDYFCFDILPIRQIIDVPNTYTCWALVRGAPGYVLAKTVNCATERSSILEEATNLGLGRECTQPHEYFCASELLQAFKAAGITGVSYSN
ncbi:hypothetical protein [Hirschia litorea]|uniref:Uncharacterized protein n=1 Tax=Hirschia litorea TaxID=1199156 RepID=A0ABW2IPS2_9PROT